MPALLIAMLIVILAYIYFLKKRTSDEKAAEGEVKKAKDAKRRLNAVTIKKEAESERKDIENTIEKIEDGET